MKISVFLIIDLYSLTENPIILKMELSKNEHAVTMYNGLFICMNI